MPTRIPIRVFALLCVPLLAGCSVVDAPATVGAGPTVALVAGGIAELYDLPSGIDAESTRTVGIRGGYRFARWASVEIACEGFGRSDLEAPGGDVGTVEGATVVAQGKGYLVNAPLQPYLLAGIGIIDLDVDDTFALGFGADETETVYKLGGGLEAHSGEHLTFFAESAWTKPDGRLSDFEYVTILAGIGWRF